MQHKFTVSITTVAAIVALSLPAFAGMALASTTPAAHRGIAPERTLTAALVATEPAVTMAHRNAEEPHPEIRRAIRSLERAKLAMQHAAHDFGGHRVAALRACDDAIAQLRLALQYDKQ